MLHKKNPLVSIIMNCRNGEKFLKSSIKSIINQSYINWELIFFDNNSQDKSFDIVKKIKDKRIKLFKTKNNLKLYRARNLALKKTKGKYICFLDTDDTWEKDKLKRQVKIIRQEKQFKFLYSNYFVNVQEKKKKYVRFNQKLSSGKITQNLLNSYDMGILTTFFEKKILKNKLFNERYNVIGDFDLFIYLSNNFKMKYDPNPLATYRVHKSNYSSKNLKEYTQEMDYWIKNNQNKKDFKIYSLIKLKFYITKLKVKLLLRKIMGV
jgi:glycosyltransferase involved in cell wall biosynthesis